jgi:GntR family phosphonate transport system transcriptional regulator
MMGAVVRKRGIFSMSTNHPPPKLSFGEAPSERHQPRWRLVQQEIERDIVDKTLAPGDRLPTEEELAERFSVHRNTIRRAIDRLREKQLVRVEQGRGTFVREPAITYKIGRGTRLTNAALRHERKPTRRILSSEKPKASRAVAAALALAPETRVLRVTMLRLIDDRAISISAHCYPLPRFAGLDELIRQTGSVSEAMRAKGVGELRRKSLRVNAVMPTAREAKLLDISRSKPLMELIQLNLDETGVPVQYSQGRFIPSWLDLVFEY